MIDTKLTGYTPDITKENVAALRQLFPEICCEDHIDFEKLRQLLGEYVEDEKERYNFTWNGKGRALRLSQQPTRGTLRPCPEESKDWDTTENLYIEGDNLEVLKLLQKSYHGKVKMIYIDPPYNTGNDFVYPDDYSDNLRNYLRMTGQVDEEGKAYSANPESSGRYHSDWLNMMYPRLRLARNLLRDDGVIFISIGQNELANLRKICDEVFGDGNFISVINWMSKSGGSADESYVVDEIEYILIYAKSKQFATMGKQVAGSDSRYKYSDKYEKVRGKYLLKKLDFRMTSAHYTETLNYPIQDPDGHDYWPGGETYRQDGGWNWRWCKAKMDWGFKNEFLEFKKNGSKWTLNSKQYEFVDNEGNPIERTLPYRNFISSQDTNTTAGSRSISECFGLKLFEYSKPIELITRLSKISSLKNDDIILDFFSGSSTTAHAVMQLNAEDGGKRRFIMVQLPEPCKPDSEAYKAGYKTICDIGKERILRAGEKIKTELREKSGGQTTLDGSGTSPNPDSLDIGFKVFKLATSNILAWRPDTNNLNKTLTDYVDNLDPNRSELDLVYELMIKEGFSLTEKIEKRTIAGKNIYSIGYGRLQICLDDHITDDVVREMVNHKPEENIDSWHVIFKDNGFASDSDKLNARERLKAAGLAEEAFRTI